MAAVGQKLELGLVRRVVGHAETVYRSPAVYGHSPEGHRNIEQPAYSSGPEPWLSCREAARGCGFVAALAASLYFTFRSVAWLLSTLLY